MIAAADLEEAASVKAALETLLYSIEDRLDDVVQAATAHVDTQLGAISDVILPPVSAALAHADINLPGEDEGGPLDWSGVSEALAHADSLLAPHEQTVAAVTQDAVNSIGLHADALLPSTTDVIGTLAKVLSDLVSGLLGNLAEVPDFWSELYTTLRDAFGQDQDPLGIAITNVLHAMANNPLAFDAFPGSIQERLAPIQGPQIPTGPLSVEDYNRQWNDQPALAKGLWNALSLAITSLSILGAHNSPMVSAVGQSALMNTPNHPLSSPELVSLLRRKQIGPDFAYQMASRTGIGREVFDLQYGLTQRLLDTQPIIEYWRRTQDDGVLEQLSRLGYSDEDIERLKQLALAIPTPADLVRFMVRDIYDPAVVLRDKLDDEFTDKIQNAPYKQVGIDVDTLKQYWMAHWQLPSPSMLYEMMHRGIIDDVKLTQALKQADWAPGWIDNLKAISFIVPGRIDVRRMWAAGVITDRPSLVRRYQDMGYSPTDADTLATFTERLKVQSDEAEAERTRAPIVRAVVQQYARRATDYDAASGMLTGLGLSADRAAFLLQEGDFTRAQDREKRITDAIGRDYVKGFLSRDDAWSRLEGYEFGDTEIGQWFESWDVDRELAEWSEERRHERDLSKSEVLKAYAERLITSADAAANLARLGYDSNEISTLVRLEDAKLQDADNRVAEQAIHTQFVNRRIDAAEASSSLFGFGLLQPRVASLLARWSVEREEKTPRVTAAQLQKMLLQGIVPQDIVEQRLTDFGYPPEDVNMLMTMYATEKQMAEDALSEKIREFDIREARLGSQGAQRIGLQSRSLDIKESEFSTSQAGLQSRFESSQKQAATLQQQRLDASSLAQSQRIAAQTAKDAANLAAARERQATTIAAENTRLDKQIAARTATAQAAIDQRDRALAQQRDLATAARAAASAQQAARLAAQAQNQQAQIDAAAARAKAAQDAAAALTATKAQNTQDLTVLRSHIQQARDIQQNANKIAAEGRAEQTRIRTEQRASARKTITATDAAANAAALQSLNLQQTQAIADVNSRFAALQAAITTQRQQTLLEQKQAAEAALATATPSASLLDT